MRSDDKKLSQSPVSHLRDATQFWFVTGSMLPGNKTQVSTKLPSRLEHTCIRNAGRETRGHNRTNAWDGREAYTNIVATMGYENRLTQVSISTSVEASGWRALWAPAGRSVLFSS